MGQLNSAEGGYFDIVIGNPPYISIQGLTVSERELYRVLFKFFYHRYDIFGCFIEKGLNLLNTNGVLCYIQPSVFLNSKSFMKCRKHIVENNSIVRLNLLKDGVFESAIVPTMIMCVQKVKKSNNIIVCSQGKLEKFYTIKQNVFLDTEANVFNLDLLSHVVDFVNKTQENCTFIENIARVSRAINIGNYSKYLFENIDENNKQYIKVLKGASIKKWYYTFEGFYLRKNFHEFISCGDLETLSKPKLMMKRIGKYPEVCYDETGIAGLDTIYTIRVTDSNFSALYLLALLNSKLIGHIFRLRVPLKGDVFPEFRIFDLNKQIPIKIISITKQQPVITLVSQILDAKKENPHADTSKWENEIDQLVYQLYELTDEEIAIVEGKE